VEFKENGHEVTIIAPALNGQKAGIYQEGNINVLRVKVFESNNVSSVIKKGLALSLMPYQYMLAYQKFLKNTKFDLILMPTPPITLIDFALFVKKKNVSTKLYLILRDIHPHSSRSIGMCNNPIMYNFLYVKAQKAYKKSDYIGCMSPGNIEYVAGIAPNIDKKKIVLLPNWQKFEEYTDPDVSIREKYGLKDKFVAIFGGTIGVGQEIENIITLAEHYKSDENIVFLVVGKGIRKQLLVDKAKQLNLQNIVFVDFLPRNDYNNLLKSVDLGIISLDHRYTVPTCPSKVIGYMATKIPVIAMINKGSDYGQYYISHCGLWSEDLNNQKMFENFDDLYNNKEKRKEFEKTGYDFYVENLTSNIAYNNIIKQVEK
jgi:glycosyltransferase involved in cell wall biosynthesis